MKYIILILFFFLTTTLYAKKREYRNFVIENNNYVFNMTELPYLDTIVQAGLMSLNIDNVIVSIKPLMDGKKDLEAYIDSWQNQYIIWVNEETDYNVVEILAHELIHLKQYHLGELYIDNLYVVWQSENFYVEGMNYYDRPWEDEAYFKQVDLMNDIYDMIYL